MYFFDRRLRIVTTLACLMLLAATASAQSYFGRERYMGSSIFSMPTGFVRSSSCYINDSGHSAVLLSQSLWNDFIELSMLRHMSGLEKNKNILNFKVQILQEDMVIPNLVWGVSDVNTQLGSKISYFAASKAIETFGVTIHTGLYNNSDLDEKELFYGFEKVIFPLVTVGAEHTKDVNTFGLKLSPYPGLSLEIAQRDGKEELYNINYIRYF